MIMYLVYVHDGIDFVHVGSYKTFEAAHEAALKYWNSIIKGSGAYIKIEMQVKDKKSE